MPMNSEARSQNRPSTQPGGMSREGRRVLVVDDDPGVLGSLQEVLVLEGYEVVPANSAARALACVESHAPDLVLLDLGLGTTSGWEAHARLSAAHPLVPVIIITAQPNQVFAAVCAGVGALLEKPLDIPILLQTIERLLGEPEPERLWRHCGYGDAFHYGRSVDFGGGKPALRAGA